MNGTESLDLVLVDEIFMIIYKHLLSTCYILGMIVNATENIKHEELMIDLINEKYPITQSSGGRAVQAEATMKTKT